MEPVSGAAAASPTQQAGPPPSPATSPRPLLLGGAGEGARQLAEQLQAGLRPLLDPRRQLSAPPALETPYARDECVHVFRVRSMRTGRTRSLVAWLRHTRNVHHNLMLAVRCNDPSRVRLLLAMGADPSRPDTVTGRTALQLAETIGSAEAAAVLREAPGPAGPAEAAPGPAEAAPGPVEGAPPRPVDAYRSWWHALVGDSREPAEPGRPAAAQPRRPIRHTSNLAQARELLHSARRRRMAREVGSVLDQLQGLSLTRRAEQPPERRPDVSRALGRLSLTSGGGEDNCSLAAPSPGGAGGLG
ncbi:translation initiation factor IF-2-like [Amphibalanus amphitrite]|nr:translation initiation factor IF-2-like [Amphibalanus amphitrite]